MVILSMTPPLLSNAVSLYYTKDALLENLPVLIFYGPSTTGNTTHNSSRIQAHIYSLAGFQTFPRLTISPSSPLYAAVYHLPAEQQGDQICRGLAVGLLSYFAGLSDSSKASLKEQAARRRPNRVAPMMFDEMHAGELASKMVKVEGADSAMAYIKCALTIQSISWIDLDIMLPAKTIRRAMISKGTEQIPSYGDDGLPLFNYGALDPLMNSIGHPSFLPTSKLRRAPSKPTAHSKHKSLLKNQKISLRREMCEFVDTEQRYVDKLLDLLHNMAPEFRHKLRGKVPGALNSSSNMVDKLFPGCLSKIVDRNTKFCEAIQNVLQSTENEAISDIEDTIDPVSEPATTGGRKRDLTGATTFAKELVKWFPEFMIPYQDFMRASVEFPDIMNEGLRDDTTNFASLVYEIGEQQLRSTLIEPIQRLPRYSLFIDNTISLLPVSHPAVCNLLKARDIITDICALDSGSFTDNSRTVGCLRNLVENWPSSLSPSGRLISAVDVAQLKAPYDPSSGGQASILLLFPETLVLLQKNENSTILARGLMNDVDNPAISSIASKTSPGSERGLIYQCAMNIFGLQITESEDGQLIWLSYNDYVAPRTAQQFLQASSAETKVFSLPSMYERKAARFCEEVIKARMEGRFPEAVRESDKWALRTLSAPSNELSILAAIWEDGSIDQDKFMANLSPIRILVDGLESTRETFARNENLEIVATVKSLEGGGYRLNVEDADGSGSSDDTTRQDLNVILVKRLSSIIQNQGQKLNASRISFNRSILRDVPLSKIENESRLRNFRPISPVKMISSFLGGGSLKSRSDLPIMKAIPLIPPQISLSRTTEKSQSTAEKQSSSKVTMIGASATNGKDILSLLEDTLATYLTAIHSKSGNVVGKVLRNRTTANELMINELYNILVEDPSRTQAAAEASIDVLFAAFEKFLKRAWREHMGPLLTSTAINNMQIGLDSGKPGEFGQHFAQSLEDMTPQNKRAFAAIIKLLSNLLDASGNDGDRGILIASFTEALVLDGNPHDYINLLDRLADDCENLFDGSPVCSLEQGQTNGSACSSLKGDRSCNTGSLGSNTSSLRKKFGFGTLSRENSKSESESKVVSVWRTLSKTSKTAGESHSQSSSLSKASLVRSRSTDTDTRMLPPVRPTSRDQPLPSNEEPRSRPGSSHLSTYVLSTIGEGTPTKCSPLAKKKRRSSLSDLKVVHEPNVKPSWSPLQLNKPDYRHPQGQTRTLPRTPSPRKPAFDQNQNKSSPQSSGSPNRFGSPHRFGSPQRFESPQRPVPIENLGSPQRKENSPLISRNVQTKKVHDSVSINIGPRKQAGLQSGIPAPKLGLSERAWPPNGSTPPKKLPQPTQKLRMQSPQKLRERLSLEQKAISTAESSLKAELAQIGEELSVFKLPRSPAKAITSTSATGDSSPPTIDSLSISLSTLSTHLSTTLAALNSRTTSISADLDSSLLVADKKVRTLDQLYREANAENEALYERFNEELGRILKGVRAGNGVEELRRKMVEAQNEVGRLRIENKRVKREVVGLKTAEMPPEQKRLIETLMTFPGQTLEEEICRRNVAIIAAIEYCKFEEGKFVPHDRRDRTSTNATPVVKSENSPSDQSPRASTRALDEAISSVLTEKRPRRCFKCVAQAKALAERRIREFGSPGDLGKLLHEFYTPGDLTKHFRCRHLSKLKDNEPCECRLCSMRLRDKDHLRHHALSKNGTVF